MLLSFSGMTVAERVATFLDPQLVQLGLLGRQIVVARAAKAEELGPAFEMLKKAGIKAGFFVSL